VRALYFDGGLRELPRAPKPRPGAGEVLVRVLYAGICATDKEIVKGYLRFQGIPGHEFVGVVEEPADSPWLGTRVVGEINCGCGSCEWCLQGDQRHCPKRTVLGIAGRDGAFAEYLTLPADRLHRVPEEVSDIEAVFVEPLAAACRIKEQLAALPERILVLGDGKLGLLAAQVLALQCEVHLFGRHPDRARRILGERVKVRDGLPEGEKFKLVVEATGTPQGLEAALKLTEPEGFVVLKSTYAGAHPFDLSVYLVVPEVTLVGSRCGPFPEAISLLAAGRISVEPLVEAVYPLSKWREAFERALRPGSLKVVLNLRNA